jgi:phospholipid N-methyltransferase
MNHALQFSRAFFRDPAATGSLVPSSRFLIERMLRYIDWDRSRVFAELGPGLGCFTGRILSRMHPNATLIAIDSNPEFTTFLRRAYKDSGLHVVLASATQLRHELQSAGSKSVDCIISGLPFAIMEPAMRNKILRESLEVLRPNGSLILFQYSTHIRPVLEAIFPSVEREFEILNIPPAHVFRCSLRPPLSFA